MKVQLLVSIHADAEAIALQLGCEVDRVHDDLVAYFASHVQTAPAVEDLDLKVDVERVAA